MRLEAKKYLYDMQRAAALLADFTSGKSFDNYANATEQHAPFVIPLSFAIWELLSTVPLITTTTALGDSEVRTTIEPAAGTRAVLAEARVVNPFPEEDISSWLIMSPDGSRELGVCVEARLCVREGT